MTFYEWVETAKAMRPALAELGVTSERVLGTVVLKTPEVALAALAELVEAVAAVVPDGDRGPLRRASDALRGLEVVPLRVRWQPDLARLHPKTDDARCLLLALSAGDL